MESIAIILWLAVTAGIRIRYLLTGNIAVTDYFNYFEAAMIQADKQEPVLTSGIAYVYSQSLSKLFWFTGNRLDIVAVYQTVIQMLAIAFLFFALRLLLGKAAAFFTGAALCVLPVFIESVYILTPENFFLLYFSIGFFLISCFYRRTDGEKKKNGAGSIFYLILCGIYAGAVCTLHFFGFLLLPVFAFALFRARSRYGKKEIICQSLFWMAGAACGILASLFYYTRITGMVIGQQWIWWIGQGSRISGTVYQDLEICLLSWVGGAVLLGIAFQLIGNRLVQKATLKKEKLQEENRAAENPGMEKPTTEKEENMEKEQQEEVRKKEGKKEEIKEETIKEASIKEEAMKEAAEEKKINYIENPLPVPKPHVAKRMDFERTGHADDFDFEINETDDFDI